MTRHKHKKPFIKLRSFYIWHRYMGLTAMLFAIMLSVTGFTLNHTEGLTLDQKQVSTDWLLDWYDIEPPQRIISYQAGEQAVSLVEDQLYVGQHSVGGHYEALAGAIHIQRMIIVAIDTHILLLTEEGEVIERLTDVNNKTRTLFAIGLHENNQFVVRTKQDAWLTDTDFLQWQKIKPGDKQVKWVTPVSIPAKQQSWLRQHYRSQVLTLERVLLDIHSGRIIGNAGVVIVDLAALLFILLSGSGFWIWLQQQRKRAAHKKKPGA